MKHPRNKAEIFCVTCETPICHVCATLKHKSPEHECIEATEATENRRQLVTKNLANLEQVKAQFREVRTRIANMKVRVKAQDHKIQKEIIQSYDELLARAEREKSVLLAEIDVATKKELDQLEKHAASVDKNISYLTGMQSQAEIIIRESSDSNFLSMYDTVLTKIKQLCRMKPDKMEVTDCLAYNKSHYSYNTPLIGKISKTKRKASKGMSSNNAIASCWECQLSQPGPCHRHNPNWPNRYNLMK